ncbi:DUF1194 domain-containing protein [Sphingomonas flavalba]|uniref:DUF1194 domain-containing protein n=1 Tax=Sphingomonas flavalba TaxID=2559804 RepID=UPI0039E09531
MSSSKFLRRTAMAAALAVGISAVPAGAATLELALAIDGSGSISGNQFKLQREAYVSVLSDLSVLPQDGSVAIGVYLFGTNVTTVFSFAEITAANHGALIAALNGMVQPGGSTSISRAINAATADIFSNAITSDRQLIDVSTDGAHNVGPNLATSRADALAAGIDQINCIGIGNGANCGNVIAGNGAFSLHASTFDDFEAALRKKIVREVTGTVPEPTTWAMLIAGFGLIGGAMRRRRVTSSVSFA